MFYDKFIEMCTIKKEKPTVIIETIGLSKGVLHKWRNGATINSDALCKLADYFNVSVDYLLGRTDKMEVNR